MRVGGVPNQCTTVQARARFLTASPSVVALDLGASKLAVRVCDRTGRHDQLIVLPAGEPATHSLERIARHLEALRRERRCPFDAAAMACAPSLDTEGIVSRWPNRPDWQGLPLRARIARALETTVYCEDDGDAAAIAEAEAAGTASLLYLGLGSGVGGGIVIDGELQHRQRAGGFEPGHIAVDFEGRLCGCGGRGCLQTVASGAAVRSACGQEDGYPDYSAVVRGLARGDEAVKRAIARAAAALAAGIVTLRECFEFDLVVLGGGLVDAVNEIVPLCSAQLDRVTPEGRPQPEVRRAQQGPASSLAGAEILARRAATSHDSKLYGPETETGNQT